MTVQQETFSAETQWCCLVATSVGKEKCMHSAGVLISFKAGLPRAGWFACRLSRPWLVAKLS